MKVFLEHKKWNILNIEYQRQSQNISREISRVINERFHYHVHYFCFLIKRGDKCRKFSFHFQSEQCLEISYNWIGVTFFEYKEIRFFCECFPIFIRTRILLRIFKFDLMKYISYGILKISCFIFWYFKIISCL